jgi:peptide chain release factor 1
VDAVALDGLEPQLRAVRERWAEIERALGDPEVIRDGARRTELLRERARLEPIQAKAEELERLEVDLDAATALLADHPGDGEWLREEIQRLKAAIAAARAEVQGLLLPRDPADERNVILELRAGAGGEEAALFVADLLRMYVRYAERRGWRTEILSSSETGMGGYREVVVGVEGEGAYRRLKFEGGVHRVQRIPATEANGRIHTSTATVAVLPEADEVDVEIRPEDLEVDTFRASGAGGQYVNRTDSAVRITHRPTGIVVTCQDERSQIKNRAKAMKVLRARLYALKRQELEASLTRDRRAQVGTGERSERIRTYNFPQNRVTDERIDLTLYQLREVLDGDLDLLLEPLLAEQQARLLRGGVLA